MSTSRARFALASVLFALIAGCSSGDPSPTWTPDGSVGVIQPPAGGAPAASLVDAGTPKDAGSTKPPTIDASMPQDASMGTVAPHPNAGSGPITTPPPTPAPLSVSFSPVGGGFSGTLSLTLSSSRSDAVVHYTLDGSLPSASSSAYSAPIALTTTTLVRALAVSSAGMSKVINQSYVVLAQDATSFDSSLPIVVVHMLGMPAPSPYVDEYVPATIAVFEPSANSRTHLNGVATHTARLGIKIRGRSTRLEAKPSYSIELRGDLEEDAPHPLLGMPSEGDWVLYAPYTFDPSLVRNAVIYEMSNRIGRYAPRTKFCEMFLVASGAELQASDYVGVYVLTEKLTRSADRIDIDKLKADELTEPDITGGYIVKIDEPDSPAEAFMAAGHTFVYVDPGYDAIAPQQTAFITEYLNSWQRAIEASDGKDPSNGNAYEALMEGSSFVDHHILNMLGKNPDAFELSSYFYKDRSGPLNAGPVWDFDLSMGNTHDKWGDRSVDPTGWGPGTGSTMFTRAPYAALFKHSAFATAYWQRWNELLGTKLTAAAFQELIEGYQLQLTEAEARNRTRWPEAAPRDGSFDAELSALEMWLSARVEWIKQHVGTVPTP